jgi:hypothetical protein
MIQKAEYDRDSVRQLLAYLCDFSGVSSISYKVQTLFIFRTDFTQLMRRLSFAVFFLCFLFLTGSAWAQTLAFTLPSSLDTVPVFEAGPPDDSTPSPRGLSATLPLFPAGAPAAAIPQMAPELALATYQRRSAQQSTELVSYSARTIIKAELPDTEQRGEFEVERHFTAPHTLEFKAVQYNGDGFVKANVITRVLQSEVDHVQKDDLSLTAISMANYKFSYKGTARLDDRTVHVYQLKPRKKRIGLFKGRIFLDVHTGSLARAEGSAAKSPSFFVKKIEFRQDYADFGSFTFPVHIHSETRARIIGRAILDIYHRDYEPTATNVQSARTATGF